jgi:hypothetical protein
VIALYQAIIKKPRCANSGVEVVRLFTPRAIGCRKGRAGSSLSAFFEARCDLIPGICRQLIGDQPAPGIVAHRRVYLLDVNSRAIPQYFAVWHDDVQKSMLRD